MLTEYVVIGLVALTLYLQRRLSSVLGVYSVYQDSAHLDWGGLPRALVEHLATFSLAFAVVPFVVALAWIGANILRPPSDPAAHAFACAGACTAVVVLVQATNFDLVVNAYIHDRFLMYLVPVVLIGAVMAVLDERRPRWSLVVPLVLVAAGFAAGEIPFATWGQFPWLDLDTPISTVYRVLTEHLGGLTPVRIVLIAVAVAGTGLFALGARSVRPRIVDRGHARASLGRPGPDDLGGLRPHLQRAGSQRQAGQRPARRAVRLDRPAARPELERHRDHGPGLE